MNSINPLAQSTVARGNLSDDGIGLADRVLAQRGKGATIDPAAPSVEDNLVPLPEPVSPIEGFIEDWAAQMFRETLMFGEEEQTGNPPLSIDI
ncbi:MAG: hypothetical protein QHC77_10850 [Stenotrophomonas sp.]|jgi:hypothetical protein|uniref:hypothetical protein n=1 Tax=Stenotrophomonas sp. TaxID=69392 RepID=UPI0029A326FA|nr:hypothetical protein [Stenotrophomonas sp.]MDX3932422.1 hypothetical protein [Stenotrophomonas sp.]